MKQIFWKILLAGIGAILIEPNSLAQVAKNEVVDQVQQYSQEGKDNQEAQVTNISELRDVSPGDWAYEALRNLVERYGCIVGYPNQTFQGNKFITRYEFAAGVSACADQMERLIVNSEAVTREDIEKLQRLSEEFKAELAALGARVDNLESRTAFLEDHNFSTTTKLEGQVVMGLAGVVTGQGAQGQDIDTVPVLGYRTRLELNTSFTGKDLLFTRLATGNMPDFSGSGSNYVFEGNISYAQPDDNQLALEVLWYQFSVTDSTQIYVAANGGAADDFTPTLNFLDGDGATGSISAFGTRNSIYYLPSGAGAAIIQQLGEKLLFTAGYLADTANDPTTGSGLFNGPYALITQLTYTPTEKLSLAVTYANSYNQTDPGTGSQLANLGFFTSDALGIDGVKTSSNSYALTFSWQLADKFVLGGWGGYSNVSVLNTAGGQVDRGSQDVWDWALTFSFPDVLKEGSLAGIVIGMEPWVADSSIGFLGASNTDKDSSFHIEGFYQYQLTDNISITPGIIWITAPNSNENNSDIVIGTVRTTFSF